MTVRRSKRQAQQAHSAGGVVVRSGEDGMHVAMIATRGRSRWGLPKGAPNPEESVAEAALREVWEETGIRAEVISLLDRIEYFFRANDKLIRKEVDFFLMRYVEGELRPQLTEVDDVEWVELSAAIDRASFESEKRILGMVEKAWRARAPEGIVRASGAPKT
jgi:8-oxo-dGTP pyrophosphatase MutT (NUDIX family)